MRVFLGLVCLLAALTASVLSLYYVSTTPDQLKVVNYDVYRTEALKMQREEVASFLSIGVLVLGALWAAMIVTKEDRLGLRDYPEVLMFMSSNIAWGMFFYFDWKYQHVLTRLYWDMGPLLSGETKFVDIMNTAYINVLRQSVVAFFYGGLGLTAVSVLSNSILRRKI
jgi:hypothetical protein